MGVAAGEADAPQLIHPSTGKKITAESLPLPSARWTSGRKATLILAVRNGVISKKDALVRCALTEEEFAHMDALLAHKGIKGLRATRAALSEEKAPEAAEPQAGQSDVLTVGDVTIVRSSGQVTAGERDVHLSPQEFSLLALLMSRAGSVVTREMIMHELYDRHGVRRRERKIVEVFVCKLRKKLGSTEENAPQYIESFWGRGYRFLVPESAAQAPS